MTPTERDIEKAKSIAWNNTDTLSGLVEEIASALSQEREESERRTRKETLEKFQDEMVRLHKLEAMSQISDNEKYQLKIIEGLQADVVRLEKFKKEISQIYKWNEVDGGDSDEVSMDQIGNVLSAFNALKGSI